MRTVDCARRILVLGAVAGLTVSVGAPMATALQSRSSALLAASASLPTLSVADTTAVEGNAENGPSVFDVRLSQKSASPVTVDYVVSSLAGDTATPGADYIRKIRTLTLSPGQTSRTIAVDTVGDRIAEPDETFSAQFSSVRGAVAGRLLAHGTILDDDPTSDDAIGVSDPTVIEGDTAVAALAFEVRLATPAVMPLTVDYTTRDGTATAASGDYLAESGSATIVVGQRSVRITIKAKGDLDKEGTERLTLSISHPSRGVITRSLGTGTIVDDDSAGAGGFPIPAGAPAVAAATSGPTFVFSRGPDGEVYFETNSGSGWSSASSLGGSIVQGPAAATGGNGSAELFARGTNDKLYSRRLLDGSWTPWSNGDGVLSSEPAAAAWGPDRDDVFVRAGGTSNALYHRALVNGAWGPWEALGGRLLNRPGASSWAPGQLSVFVRGADSHLYGRFYSSRTGSWTAWTNYGGVLTAGPGVVSVPGGRDPGRVTVFVTGMNGAVFEQTIANGRPGGWVSLGGVLAGGPAASSTGPGHYRVVGASTNGRLYERVYDGTWTAWAPIP
jgi:hypothetical protein